MNLVDLSELASLIRDDIDMFSKWSLIKYLFLIQESK